MRVTLPTEPLGGAGSTPYVLLVHGYRSSFALGFYPELCRRLAEAGLAAVALNLSGSGIGDDYETFDDPEAFARNTYTRELEDIERVRAAIDAGRWPELDPVRGAVFGHSRGGAMAILHAAERGDYRALVTWAAMDAVLRFSPERIALWREQGFLFVFDPRTGDEHRLEVSALEDAEQNAARLDIHAACARLRCPSLFVHGRRDAALEHRAAERLAQATASGLGTVRLIDRAGHSFGARHPLREVPPVLEEAIDATLGFLLHNLGEPDTPDLRAPAS